MSASSTKSAATSGAANSQWHEVGGWHGGTVVAVALAPDRQSDKVDGNSSLVQGLIASRAGIYQWREEGDTVEPRNGGLSDPSVLTVAFAGATGSAFAATATGRLFRTNIAAEERVQWEEVGTWAGLGVAVILAISPAYDEDKGLFVGTPTGIFRTQDDCLSWESCNFGLLDEEVLCLTCAPNFAESELLWAGTAGGGLYRSRNSGRAWRESGMGLPDAAIQALAVSPGFEVDRTLYAGTEGYGLFVSKDGGENWLPLALEGQSVNSLVAPHAGLLWAGTERGLWRIDPLSGQETQLLNGGDVMTVAASAQGQVAVGWFGNGFWHSDNANLESQTVAWLHPKIAIHAPPVVKGSSDALFALDSDGLVARSTTGGASWELLEGASAAGVTSMSATGGYLFVASEMGLIRIDDAGSQFVDGSREVLQGRLVLDLSSSAVAGRANSLLAVTQDGELLASGDGGVSWQSIRGHWQGHSLLSARFAPDNANEVVALTVQPSGEGHFALTLWHSDDLGGHWDVLAGFSSNVPAAVMAWEVDDAEGAIYLATQHRVIKLFEKGHPPTLQVHQHFFDDEVRVTALTHEDGDSATLWAATTAGLFRSADRGITWVRFLETPLDLPIIWLECTQGSVDAMTLGGRMWRANLQIGAND